MNGKIAFKYFVLSDSLSVLDNWNYDDPTPCLWTSVTCEPLFGLGLAESFAVSSLVFKDSHLMGSVPHDLGMTPHLCFLVL
ncbi:hypothetical protein R6Q57_019259 [Mikania cordata]